MKAILLAAGFGTRLRPLTNTIPKCLVPIKGKPLLEIWLDNLYEAGVREFLINTHYLSNQVNSFIIKSKYKNLVTISHEEVILGTAGTLISNLDFIKDQDCLLIHADNYCLANFKIFINNHNNRPKKTLMTMMTFKTDNPSSCGVVKIDKFGIVKSFYEKVDSPPSNLANGAVYILSQKFIKIISTEKSKAIDFSKDILPFYMNKIYTYYTDKPFIDIGNEENYIKANNLIV